MKRNNTKKGASGKGGKVDDKNTAEDYELAQQ